MNRDSSLLLSIKNLSYAYKTTSETIDVLKGVNLELGQNKHVGLLGASGVGKSTFLNIIGLIDTPLSGTLKWHQQGKTIDLSTMNEKQRTLFRRKNIGFIHQSHYLFHEFTALENIMLPQMIVGTEKSGAKKRAMDLLALMSMTDRAHHRPSQLSGGQKQRVSIARALANKPPLVLADEPTGHLDDTMAKEVFGLFQEMCHKEKTCMVMATHDLTFAKNFDEVFYIKKMQIHKKNIYDFH
jgi:lipoprotein-releasing system ATP-binding protein